jgi:hypothetical protein
MKKLPEEIDRADLYAVCRACKGASIPQASPTDATGSTSAVVYRRGFQRRHGVDRRETDE